MQTVMNRQPRNILERYSPADVRRLYAHLHNENPEYRYVCGFRRKDGSAAYTNADKFKRLRASDSIEWSIRTAAGATQSAKRHCYVPLPNNPDGKSRWAGIDFDAHEAGELIRASELALRFFLAVVNEPFFVVLETSGVGFKLWLIAQDFHNVSWWRVYLESLCERLGVKPQSGVVELFPDREPKNYGRGLRAPGAWNPRNDCCNGILFDDVGALLPSIPVPGEIDRIYRIGELEPRLSRGTGFGELLERFAIRQPATRHRQLLALVGRLHVMACFEVAQAYAQAQFDAKTVATAADLAQHLTEFDALWTWQLSKWYADLSPAEAAKFDGLSSDAERAAFRIIRDFHRSAKHRGQSEFPISRDSLARRIRLTGEGAGKLRHRFCHAGIIERVSRPIAHKRCAFYRWTGGDNDSAPSGASKPNERTPNR